MSKRIKKKGKPNPGTAKDMRMKNNKGKKKVKGMKNGYKKK